MVRQKKADTVPVEGATITIDVDNFVRYRDRVVTGLATLQDAIQTLSSAYLKHTNAVLGEHGAGLDLPASLLGEPLLGNLGSLRAPGSPSIKSIGGVPDLKEKKKKRAHDPNAPKRPLTPYFLYMQTARPIIAEDLGPDVAKGAVSTEGVRRWNAMAAQDKQLWTNAYTDNLKLYNARVHAYKHGNPTAKDMSDEEAAAYADEHNIGAALIHEATADGQLTSEALMDLPTGGLALGLGMGLVDAPGEDDDDIEDAPVAPKTPPKAKGRAAKNAAAAAGSAAAKKGAAAATQATPQTGGGAIVPPGSKASAAPAAHEASPDKKRKRKSTGRGQDEALESVEVETAKEKGKPRKKKSKGE